MAGFKPRERKHKRLAKVQKASDQADTSNAETVIPQSAADKELRRQQLAAELRAHNPEAVVSGKKRKRLDKYIDNKLRKEESVGLLKKLGAQRVDTSLLRSSKTLGRLTESKRERFGRALRERNAGIDTDGNNDDILLQRRRDVSCAGVDVAGDSDEVDDGEEELPLSPRPQSVVKASAFGTGLKRPLDTDVDGKPIIKRRKRRPKLKPQPLLEEELENSIGSNAISGSDEDEWHGFGSNHSVTQFGRKDLNGSVLRDEFSEEGSGDERKGEDSANMENETRERETDEGSEDDTEEDSDTDSADLNKPARVSAFKAWADSVRNAAIGFTPSTLPTDDTALRAKIKPRAPSPDPLASSIVKTDAETTARPAAAIVVARSEEVQAARLELPIVQEEQKIMEAVHNNPVVIICGATGSGKTTQVPQMLFENGYGSHAGGNHFNQCSQQSRGLIGVTQPRRVAAMSVAERVAMEVGSEHKDKVAYQVRYDTNVGSKTAIKFMTDGILLREINQDFILSKYSVIVIDEAHERSVNTDILIGMLARIVPLRTELAREEPERHYPLKLVIMSATLRVADFAENARLFRDVHPPIVEAEGRQYPVTEHFSRKTHRGYVEEMVNKVAKGHRKLPPGSMLVFLTSQNEIQAAAKKLKDRLGSNTAGLADFGPTRDSRDEISLEVDDLEDGISRHNNDYLEHGEDESESESETEITGIDGDADDEEFAVEDNPEFAIHGFKGALKPHILPLYAALPSAQQMRVFQPPPDGSRLIVLATNVAETSLTIPGIRYVFDCGRSKEKRYEPATGVQTFEIDWISKASASQRAGRAGRTGPGHCYRLFSSAVYEQYFAQHTVPEILRTPLESTILQLKNMEINNVANFPFPTAPDPMQILQADRLLRNLGAIAEKDGFITQSGKNMMPFPVNPRFAKMLLLAQRNRVVPHMIALVAGLAVGDLYIPEVQVSIAEQESQIGSTDNSEDSDSEENDRKQRRSDDRAHTASQQRHQAYTRAHARLSRWDDQSDIIKLLTVVAAYAGSSNKSQFCAEYFLREKGMVEVQQLRHQLQNIVNARHPTEPVTFRQSLDLPKEKEIKMLNQIVAAGFIDQVAIRADLLENNTTTSMTRKPRRATEVPYRSLVPSNHSTAWRRPEEQQPEQNVYIHPSSVLAHLSVKEMPSYVVYSHLSRPAPIAIDSTQLIRTRMHPLTTVGPKQLAALAEGTGLLEIGKPIGRIEDLSRDAKGAMRRQCVVGISLRGSMSTEGWPIGGWKVVQKRDRKGEWAVEKVLAR
nr:putative atp-dependent rna helicase pb1a10.06c [Quercus suber]